MHNRTNVLFCQGAVGWRSLTTAVGQATVLADQVDDRGGILVYAYRRSRRVAEKLLSQWWGWTSGMLPLPNLASHRAEVKSVGLSALPMLRESRLRRLILTPPGPTDALLIPDRPGQLGFPRRFGVHRVLGPRPVASCQMPRRCLFRLVSVQCGVLRVCWPSHLQRAYAVDGPIVLHAQATVQQDFPRGRERQHLDFWVNA